MFRKVLFLLAMLVVAVPATVAAESPADHVGRSVCAGCHEQQASLWSGSHHDLAMQEAGEETVLGDFDDASLTHFGVTSTFFRKDGRFMVRTEGPAGKPQEYQIDYVFGVDPLQQYLIGFPGGRLQALSLAWDARPQAQGGQRWFHLYPDERISHDDELHWTQPSQNWNSMCAECHSTRLRKNYDPATRTFATGWSEIDVSCEACHGPGSKHVAWAKRAPGWQGHGADKGLEIAFDERSGVRWTISDRTGSAVRSRPRTGAREIEMCARCHARRTPISDGYVHGEGLLDHYRPRLLDADLYFADGQIDGEVYVYGSFIQSRMYHAGVTCSDCHEPHSLQLRAPGNGVCLQCHKATKYDRTGHHHHAPDSSGAKCVECHMPAKTYMVVDPRRDHSMRIPRPDQSVELGTPDACTNCHKDQSPAWAAGHIERWYGEPPTGFQTYAEALHGARNQAPGSAGQLAAVLRDTDVPAIARATALGHLRNRLDDRNLQLVVASLTDEDALVRQAAVTLLEQAPPEFRQRYAMPLLEDPVRAVRIEAARILAGLPTDGLGEKQQQLLDDGLQEFIAAQMAMAERPEARTNLANLYATQGNTAEAIRLYRAVIELDPAYVPAYANLADLYRSQGKETEAEKVLRRAIEAVPGNAVLHHALGLSLVRQQRTGEALEELRLAAGLAPEDAHLVYVYAVALQSTGKTGEALMVLQGAHNAHPDNAAILNALVVWHQELGNTDAARRYAGKLRAVAP